MKNFYGDYLITEENNVEALIELLKVVIRSLEIQKEHVKRIESFEVFIKTPIEGNPIAKNHTIGFKYLADEED